MAGQDYLYWQSQDKKTWINELIKDIERNGVLNGIGKPEALKYRKGFSRRIKEWYLIHSLFFTTQIF